MMIDDSLTYFKSVVFPNKAYPGQLLIVLGKVVRFIELISAYTFLRNNVHEDVAAIFQVFMSSNHQKLAALSPSDVWRLVRIINGKKIGKARANSVTARELLLTALKNSLVILISDKLKIGEVDDGVEDPGLCKIYLGTDDGHENCCFHFPLGLLPSQTKANA